MITAAQGVSPAIYKKMSYDPVKDLATITLMASLPSLLTVHPALPAKNVKELLVLAKTKPDGLSYASTGNGSSPHMLMEMFKFMTGAIQGPGARGCRPDFGAGATGLQHCDHCVAAGGNKAPACDCRVVEGAFPADA
jgi:hypothetical protein